MSVYETLESLGISLPPVTAPVAAHIAKKNGFTAATPRADAPSNRP